MGKARSSQQDRLYRRVLEASKNCSFEWLKGLLEAYGFEQRKQRSGSSHFIFKRPGRMPISVPYSRPVKERYVREVLEAIDAIELEEGNET